MAPTTLGLSGLVTGLLLGLWHRRGRDRQVGAAAEPTEVEPEVAATDLGATGNPG